MGIIRNIRTRIAYFLLAGKFRSVNRQIEAVNLSAAKKIAIVFQPSNQESFDLIRGFVKKLRERDIEVTAVGFIDAKQIPNIYLLRKGYHFFCRKDLNWYLRPKVLFVENFVHEEYDILIDLCLERNFPADYLTALSKARFKAGKHFPGSKLLDLGIDISKANRLDFLILQLEHYLDLINKPQNYEASKI